MPTAATIRFINIGCGLILVVLAIPWLLFPIPTPHPNEIVGRGPLPDPWILARSPLIIGVIGLAVAGVNLIQGRAALRG
jgi:hypothetical protein